MTEAKQKLMLLSSPSEIRFVSEWITGEIGLPIVPCQASDLYAAYLKWCRANGESRPRPSNQFHGAISHMAEWEKKKARIYPNEHATSTEPRPMVFPPPGTVEAAGNGLQQGTHTSRWLTDCVNRFSEALKSAEGMQWAA